METVFRKGIYSILKVFYDNQNSSVYLRELARRTKLNENSISRFLNELVKNGILISKKEDSVRKFFVSKKYLPVIFSIFDYNKLDNLSFVRKKAIEDYLSKTDSKPFCIILFGSTATGNERKSSDLDLLEINDSLTKNSKLLNEIESGRGIKLQIIKLTLNDFNKSISQKDPVILSALKTGFPVFGRDFFYGVLINE